MPDCEDRESKGDAVVFASFFSCHVCEAKSALESFFGFEEAKIGR